MEHRDDGNYTIDEQHPRRTELEDENMRLRDMMRALRDDLLLRGDLMNGRSPDGRIVVNVSQTVWNNFCAAIGDRA
jgi:hypothetical protein